MTKRHRQNVPRASSTAPASRVHYDTGYGVPACRTILGETTAIPRKVTCPYCKRSESYREMMEDPDEPEPEPDLV